MKTTNKTAGRGQPGGLGEAETSRPYTDSVADHFGQIRIIKTLTDLCAESLRQAMTSTYAEPHRAIARRACCGPRRRL